MAFASMEETAWKDLLSYVSAPLVSKDPAVSMVSSLWGLCLKPSQYCTLSLKLREQRLKDAFHHVQFLTPAAFIFASVCFICPVLLICSTCILATVCYVWGMGCLERKCLS